MTSGYHVGAASIPDYAATNQCGKGTVMNEPRYMISDASKQLHVEAHVLRYWEDELQMDIPRTELGHRYYTKLHLLAFERIKQLKEAGYQLKAIKLILPKLTELDEEEFEFISLVADEMNHRAAEYDNDAELSETELPENDTATLTTDSNTAEMLFAPSAETTETNAEMLQAAVPYPLVHTAAEDAYPDFSAGEDMTALKHLPSNVIPINRPLTELTHDEKLQQFQALMTGAVSTALQTQAKQFGDLLSDQLSEKLLREMDYLLRLRQEQEELRFQQLDETIRSHQKSMQEVAASRSSNKRKRHR